MRPNRSCNDAAEIRMPSGSIAGGTTGSGRDATGKALGAGPARFVAGKAEHSSICTSDKLGAPQAAQ